MNYSHQLSPSKWCILFVPEMTKSCFFNPLANPVFPSLSPHTACFGSIRLTYKVWRAYLQWPSILTKQIFFHLLNSVINCWLRRFARPCLVVVTLEVRSYVHLFWIAKTFCWGKTRIFVFKLVIRPNKSISYSGACWDFFTFMKKPEFCNGKIIFSHPCIISLRVWEIAYK